MAKRNPFTSRRLQLHLLYWLVFVLFFSWVWGTYDQEYGRNVMVQLWSLPARLLLVYGTLGFLFPRFFEKGRYVAFTLGFVSLLLFCSLVIQRSVMLFIVEGWFLPYKSAYYFHVSELMNTTIDVGIAAIIPLAYRLFSSWQASRQALIELGGENRKAEEGEAKSYMMIKEGAVKHKIPFEEILYVESLRNYVKINTLSQELISYGGISAMSELLPETNFLRVHRSFIVNLQHLKSFSSKSLNIGGKEIPIGRTYKQGIEERLKGL